MIKTISKLKNKAYYLRGKDVRLSQNLGNGFRRDIFTAKTVAANTFVTFRLQPASNRVVISGGWRVSGFTRAHANESFPIEDNVWFMTIYNDTTTVITVTPYLISKLR